MDAHNQETQQQEGRRAVEKQTTHQNSEPITEEHSAL